MILVLVFAGTLMLSSAALMSFVLGQSKLGVGKIVREQAFSIAEAGLEYYHWFLTVYPDDLTNGTGGPGPYVHTYSDPQDGPVGEFSLSVQGNIACGVVQSIDVTSVGTVDTDSRFTRTLTARHAKPSVAEYAYVTNSSLWMGVGEDVVGAFHSNGGIRMDGENNALVTSAVSSWTCTSGFGCSPDQSVDGIFGAGGGGDLWQYPVGEIVFDDIVQDVSDLKTYAQTGGGLYFALSGESDAVGHHFIFNSNDTVDVYEVTGTSGEWAWNSNYGYDYSGYDGWRWEYNAITNQSYIGNYAIPSDCSLIFSEDKVWVEGTVSGKVTLVAADTGSYDPDIVVHDDLDYSVLDGSAGLTLIAEENLLISSQSPNDLIMRGIFVAQDGHFGRNYYDGNMRDTLTVQGTIVSNGRENAKWTCGSSFCSGYDTRINSYDRHLTTSPPPFTPAHSQDPEYVLWQEN